MASKKSELAAEVERLSKQLRAAKLELRDSEPPVDSIDRFYWWVGSELRKGRNAAGLTQEALIEQIGLTRTSLVNIEQGNQRAPLHRYYQICCILGLEFPEVMARVLEAEAEYQADG